MRQTRRQVLELIGMAAASTPFTAQSVPAAQSSPKPGTALREKTPVRAGAATRLYADALVWDNHSGFDPRPDFDLEHLAEWRNAGIDYLSIDVGYDVIDWKLAIQNLGRYITWLEKRPERFALVRSAEQILQAKRAGKMAIAFDLEGMNALNGDASMVSLYYRLGVRQMLTAYNRNNLAGGGCHDDDHGLTNFGRDVIAEMNRVGMMVDCSHTGYRTTMDIMAMAKQPVVFSHSNPKALRAHGRNITDDQIRACARTGGVVAINGIGLFLPDRNATTQTMTDCIVYVRDLVGADHVGIGLDYDPEWATTETIIADSKNNAFWPPSEYAEQGPAKSAAPAQIPQIAEALLDRGWPDGDIKKVLGGNFLRVAREVWK